MEGTTANMANRAMDRIRDEMAKAGSNGAIRQLGELITLLLPRHPEWAGAMADDKKSLKGAYDAMYQVARKGRWQAMTDAEGLTYALTHYGIEVTAMAMEGELAAAWLEARGMKLEPAPAPAPEPAPATEPEPPQAPAGGMDLNDLLEGL